MLNNPFFEGEEEQILEVAANTIIKNPLSAQELIAGIHVLGELASAGIPPSELYQYIEKLRCTIKGYRLIQQSQAIAASIPFGVTVATTFEPGVNIEVNGVKQGYTFNVGIGQKDGKTSYNLSSHTSDGKGKTVYGSYHGFNDADEAFQHALEECNRIAHEEM